jgi:hypothetical protein
MKTEKKRKILAIALSTMMIGGIETLYSDVYMERSSGANRGGVDRGGNMGTSGATVSTFRNNNGRITIRGGRGTSDLNINRSAVETSGMGSGTQGTTSTTGNNVGTGISGGSTDSSSSGTGRSTSSTTSTTGTSLGR